MRHPARYSDALLPVMANMLQSCTRICDPMAGTGKIFLLENWLPNAQISAFELEPEWANMHPRTKIGNVLCLDLQDCSVDAICVSPPYGNRLADHHEANDGSQRRSYKFDLGRNLHPDNAGGLQWGDDYRVFHTSAWSECKRILVPYGKFLLNIKNHIRNGKEQLVSEWHVECLENLGFIVRDWRKITTPSLRYGKNHNARVEYESLILLELTC